MGITEARADADAVQRARTAAPYTDGPAAAAAFLDALTKRDFGALGAVLARDARFRALVPPGPIERTGSGEVVEQLSRWFGSSEEFEVQDAALEAVSDRVRVRYRFRLRPHPFDPDSGWHVIEQQGYCQASERGIEALDVVCTGFRPEPEEEPGVHHTYDAGTTACGDGLSEEFGRRLAAIAVGDVLTVVARDPAARDELPRLAHRLGHRVLSVEAGDDGSLSITVERAR